MPNGRCRAALLGVETVTNTYWCRSLLAAGPDSHLEAGSKEPHTAHILSPRPCPLAPTFNQCLRFWSVRLVIPLPFGVFRGEIGGACSIFSLWDWGAALPHTCTPIPSLHLHSFFCSVNLGKPNREHLHQLQYPVSLLLWAFSLWPFSGESLAFHPLKTAGAWPGVVLLALPLLGLPFPSQAWNWKLLTLVLEGRLSCVLLNQKASQPFGKACLCWLGLHLPGIDIKAFWTYHAVIPCKVATGCRLSLSVQVCMCMNVCMCVCT